MIDIEEELKIFENSVRDTISFILKREYGDDWIDHLAIPKDRITHWKERREIEIKRLSGTPLEERLIYYSDFYDLKNILSKHWNEEIKKAFGDKKRMEVFFEELEKLRDPNAHRRELFDYQKHLIKGISGYVRTNIMKYRGKKEDIDDYFPVIESVRDSLGNSAINPGYAQAILSPITLRVGDEVEISVTSIDPYGDELEYSIARIGHKEWGTSNKVILKFSADDIGKTCDINVMIKSKRNYHAYNDFDDYVWFRYVVLP